MQAAAATAVSDMTPPRALLALALLVVTVTPSKCEVVDIIQHENIYNWTDEEYYSMPRLFQLDEYNSCVGAQGVYCLGSFELTAPPTNQLFHRLQVYSSDWVQHYNHTRLHRGYCLTRRCPHMETTSTHDTHQYTLHAWFSSCVNVTTMAEYNISARLYHVDYCTRGHQQAPITTNVRAFTTMITTLLTLALVSTTLDMTLPDQAKKGYGWALSWSLRLSWRTLTAPPPETRGDDMRFLDGLRVMAMMCVIIEHVGWLTSGSYVADTRFYEQKRQAGDVMLLTNSTQVVQIFFIMASFLLAHKLLQQDQLPATKTFFKTMLNRIIRVSPSYFLVIWFAASWWETLGSGPQWSSLVRAEAAVCRHKWWTHLLYLNNLIYPDEKCLIQTWYLAADMQLYAVALILTLVLRGRRAILTLTLLTLIAAVAPFALAYSWNLMPTYVVHRPESVRLAYGGDLSFNVLYQSPVGNAAAMLAGLLMAHAHHALQATGINLAGNKIFWWASVMSIPGIFWWVIYSPGLLPPGPPPRFGAAALAAFERPVFTLISCIGIFGALQGVDSLWRRILSGSATPILARLSFGALLLHIPLNKALLGTRLRTAQIDRYTVFFEFFGMTMMSYVIAVPLAMLVEFPTQRLYRELTTNRNPPPRSNNEKSNLK